MAKRAAIERARTKNGSPSGGPQRSAPAAACACGRPAKKSRVVGEREGLATIRSRWRRDIVGRAGERALPSAPSPSAGNVPTAIAGVSQRAQDRRRRLPACRGRRRCRCGRRGWGSWRAPARPAARPAACARSRAQLAASSATKAMRSGTRLRRSTMSASVARRRRPAPLNETARVMMRPSISGSATFIARSRGRRPRVPSRQASASPPAKITCSTGQSARRADRCRRARRVPRRRSRWR